MRSYYLRMYDVTLILNHTHWHSLRTISDRKIKNRSECLGSIILVVGYFQLSEGVFLYPISLVRFLRQ